MRRVLVTGGAGYIGSHTCKALAKSGIEPIVYDNLSNGHRRAVRWGPLVVGDIADRHKVAETIRQYRPEAVIHFAAFAYVGESVTDPGKYYSNNVAGTISLLEAMRAEDVDAIVFSSTCATYGTPETLPIDEDAPQRPINPYGASKLMIERVLEDYATGYGLRYATLRYFNACGLDPDGELGEDHDPETHLIPRALMAAAGTLPVLEIFGDDYPTEDGTCVRDYIHVMDLADAHIKAFEKLHAGAKQVKVNLGTGTGHSIFEVLEAVKRVTGRDVPTTIRPRRAGDPAALYASCALAAEVLEFKARQSDLDTIVRTAWPHFSAHLPKRGLPRAAGISVAGRGAVSPTI
jgi:UDP-arabinose 4-epimerase